MFLYGGALGPCPNNAELCGGPKGGQGTLTCVNDCSAQGHCVSGKCACNVGMTGSDCSQPVCWTDLMCKAGQACAWSGECVQRST